MVRFENIHAPDGAVENGHARKFNRALSLQVQEAQDRERDAEIMGQDRIGLKTFDLPNNIASHLAGIGRFAVLEDFANRDNSLLIGREVPQKILPCGGGARHARYHQTFHTLGRLSPGGISFIKHKR